MSVKTIQELFYLQTSSCTLLQKIGQDGAKCRKFYQQRTLKVVTNHRISIDGTLTQDTSKVNDLSAFSYKARTKGCKDVSVVYAYDIEMMEPIYAEVLGNSIDASSYAAFIRDNDIKNGIIVSDKGFPPSKIKSELQICPNFHFITPIKRNGSRISCNNMLDFEGVLEGLEKHVLYKKARIKGGRFLYAFKDLKVGGVEEAVYLAKAEKNKSSDAVKYAIKKEIFGVIVFELNQDLPPETAYLCYDDRWLLELVFNCYKNDEYLDRTDVQGGFSLIGTEFINFISTVAACRILRKARAVGSTL